MPDRGQLPDQATPAEDRPMTRSETQAMWSNVYRNERDRFERERDEARKALEHERLRSARLRRTAGEWKAAAGGWQSQTDEEVAWREQLRAENAELRERLERLREHLRAIVATTAHGPIFEAGVRVYVASALESDEEVASDG